ncbi:MAG: hypothetical protein Pg6B_09910 [Candidatus Azobacteroides pseudotrichonymphae]|nr:MAG: hypothetical protein Pg6B_09910 [Candidatus Azobacteroides pseudotrichonymphae]
MDTQAYPVALPVPMCIILQSHADIRYDDWYRDWGVRKWNNMYIYSINIGENHAWGSIPYALHRNGFATNMALLISASMATFMLHHILTHPFKWDRISKLFKRKSDNKG